MGELIAIKVLTTLTKDYMLSDDMRVTWDKTDARQASRAEKVFQKYIIDGWMAFSEGENGRKQIFKFDPKLAKIILMPPLGGG